MQVHLDDADCLKNKKEPISWFVVNEVINYKGQKIAIQKEGRKITPFKINDSAFVDAFRYVFDSHGLDKVRNRRTSVIKDDFLESVLKRIKKK